MGRKREMFVSTSISLFFLNTNSMNLCGKRTVPLSQEEEMGNGSPSYTENFSTYTETIKDKVAHAMI